MRRKDREVTRFDDIIAIIKRCSVCRLAFNDTATGYPYILPLNFGFTLSQEGKLTLLFHGATEGYKYEVIARDPRASFQMDANHNLISDDERGYCTFEYESVMGQGKIAFIEERDEKLKALTIITDNYHKEHFAFNEKAVDRTTVMKLEVEKITAKVKVPHAKTEK